MSQTRLPVLMTRLGASFRCTQCGDCCRGWAVNVDERTHKTIVEALSRRPHPGRLGAAQGFVILDSPTPDAYARMRQTPDGACVFLEPDNLCYLHKHFGPEVKPVPCRTYPFRPVQRPQAILAPASVHCTSLKRNLSAVGKADGATTPLDLVEVDHPGLGALAYDRYSPGAYTKLGAGHKLPVEVLAQVEDRLIGFLTDEDLGGAGGDAAGRSGLDLAGRLFGMRALVDDLVALPGDRITPRTARAAHDQLVGAGPTGLTARLAALRPDPRQHIALLLGVLQSFDATAAAEMLPRLRAAFGLDRDLSLEERDALLTRRYSGFFESPAVRAPLLAFLGERLRASNITLRHGLCATVQAVVCAAALVRFLACGRMANHEEGVGRVAVLQSIDEVELLFFHNLRVLELFGEGSVSPLRSGAAAAHLLLPGLPS